MHSCRHLPQFEFSRFDVVIRHTYSTHLWPYHHVTMTSGRYGCSMERLKWRHCQKYIDSCNNSSQNGTARLLLYDKRENPEVCVRDKLRKLLDDHVVESEEAMKLWLAGRFSRLVGFFTWNFDFFKWKLKGELKYHNNNARSRSH